jgi:hypothetical protein
MLCQRIQYFHKIRLVADNYDFSFRSWNSTFLTFHPRPTRDIQKWVITFDDWASYEKFLNLIDFMFQSAVILQTKLNLMLKIWLPLKKTIPNRNTISAFQSRQKSRITLVCNTDIHFLYKASFFMVVRTCIT